MVKTSAEVAGVGHILGNKIESGKKFKTTGRRYLVRAETGVSQILGRLRLESIQSTLTPLLNRKVNVIFVCFLGCSVL